ncbi:MAG: hypothetical protein ACLR8Y_11945 [Alistipes indistinctus]
MPFWHLNGTLTRDTIVKQINRAKREAGFGGIAVLPVSGTRPGVPDRRLFRGDTTI